MILILLLAGVGLGMAADPRRVRVRTWVIFGFVLWLCLLTRHINAVFVALMPLTFCLVATTWIAMALRATPPLARGKFWLMGKRCLKTAAFASVLGISCFVLSDFSARLLCQFAAVEHHSQMGVTFMWRLKFLSDLPVEQRNQLLETVSRKTGSSETRALLALLQQSHATDVKWDPVVFLRIAHQSLAATRGTELSEA